jgi:GNAT superfamily N-acetyltransferase
MIRELRTGDLPQLTHLCRVGLEHDQFFEQLVSEKTLGAHDFDPNLAFGVEHRTGRLVGFVCGVLGRRREVPYAFVRLMVVDPAHRNHGFGSQLLNEFQRRSRERGARRVSIMDVPGNYFMPGLDPMYTEGTCFLVKHGYERATITENLICEVRPGRWDCRERSEALARQGLTIRRAAPGDANALEAFLAAEFPGWEWEVLRALRHDPPLVHLCIRGEEVIAFAAAEGNNQGTGWFGPMGTRPAARGKGIGAITLQLCLNDLADLGHRQAIIPWVGPVRFYARFCGARRHRTFWVYQKDLTS